MTFDCYPHGEAPEPSTQSNKNQLRALKILASSKKNWDRFSEKKSFGVFQDAVFLGSKRLLTKKSKKASIDT